MDERQTSALDSGGGCTHQHAVELVFIQAHLLLQCPQRHRVERGRLFFVACHRRRRRLASRRCDGASLQSSECCSSHVTDAQVSASCRRRTLHTLAV